MHQVSRVIWLAAVICFLASSSNCWTSAFVVSPSTSTTTVTTVSALHLFQQKEAETAATTPTVEQFTEKYGVVDVSALLAKKLTM